VENVIGFVVFAVIAAFSMYSKYREQKAAEEAAKRRRVRKRPEDLPERTRKMLYGESGVPPKRGAQPEYRQAQPRTAPGPQRPKPLVQQRQERRPVEERHTVLSREEPDRQAQMRQKRAEAQAALERMWHQAKAAEQRARRQQQPKQQRRAAKQVQQAPAQPQAERPVHKERRPQRAVRGSKAARRRQLDAMFNSRGALRAGIILTEVLGPPVGMREQQRGGIDTTSAG